MRGCFDGTGDEWGGWGRECRARELYALVDVLGNDVAQMRPTGLRHRDRRTHLAAHLRANTFFSYITRSLHLTNRPVACYCSPNLNDQDSNKSCKNEYFSIGEKTSLFLRSYDTENWPRKIHMYCICKQGFAQGNKYFWFSIAFRYNVVFQQIGVFPERSVS